MATKPTDQLSPAYRRRIERALAQGKTRQQARGHKAQEHVYRREREREENEGLSRAEEASIRAWCDRYRNETRETEDVVEEAQQRGYAWFQNYRAVWNSARRAYLRETADGSYASRGLQYLKMLADAASVDEMSWLYYH